MVDPIKSNVNGGNIVARFFDHCEARQSPWYQPQLLAKAGPGIEVTMTSLLVGIALLGGLHLISILLPGLRDGLRTRLGERPWRAIYAAVSLVGLGFMIRGFMQSRSGPLAADWLYFPSDGLRHVTMLLVLLGLILIAAAYGKGYIRRWVHNPMSLGIVLWSTGHLLANGKRTDVLMFGTFLAVGLADIVVMELRGKRPSYQPNPRSDVIAVVFGMVLYVIFLFGFHPYILNLPVVQ